MKLKRLLCATLGLMMISTLTACDANEQIVIKLGHGNGSSDSDVMNQFAYEFKRLVEEYTNDEITVQVYPSSQLGDESEMFGSAGLDTLEAALGATTNYVSYAPMMNFSVLPYVFDTLEECQLFFDENIDWMNEYCIPQANSRVLYVGVGGMRSLACNADIQSIDDVKNMIVRVPPTTPMINFWEAVGAAPQVVAWAEVYTALEQGVADAVCGNEWILIDNKFGEVCDYFSYIDYMPQPNALVLSEDFYQSLSPEHQEAVTRAGYEAGHFFLDISEVNRDKYRKLAEDTNGVIFTDAPADLDLWKEIGKSTWEMSYAATGSGDAQAGKEIIDYVYNYGKS